MKKLYSQAQWIRYSKKRARKTTNRKRSNKLNSLTKRVNLTQRLINFSEIQEVKSSKVHEAPLNFSFVDNTDDILAYLQETERLIGQNKPIIFDISKVQSLTSDAIALFVAFISGKNARLRGNEPEKEELKAIFAESGFYKHVKIPKKFSSTTINKDLNLLHKETHNKVTPSIAEDAVMRGLKHTGLDLQNTDAVYDILIESMQNTNNHAWPNRYGNCNWWLYVYNDPKENVSKYSFVDLGVGIFKSLRANGLLRRFLKENTSLIRNITLVDDLLQGKIQSRIEEDQEIRGKGIPQIVEYAQTDLFKKFYIIANDVKVDVKTGEKWQLSHNMDGTFLYWELYNKKRNGN